MYRQTELVASLKASLSELPPLVSPHDAAKALNVSTRTIHRWRKSGRLRTLKTSASRRGKVLIPRDELQRLLETMVE